MAIIILDDRRSGLENVFFAQQEAILLRRLDEADEVKARKAALSAASGIKDDAVLVATFDEHLWFELAHLCHVVYIEHRSMELE